MVIYGVALLSGCFLIGKVTGSMLGNLLGVKADVGGVGIAMVLLVLGVEVLMRKGKLNEKSQEGIKFWNAMYIPIIVAMAATQDVFAALKGGPLALVAGGVTTVVCFLLVPVISKLGNKKNDDLILKTNP